MRVLQHVNFANFANFATIVKPLFTAGFGGRQLGYRFLGSGIDQKRPRWERPLKHIYKGYF